VGTPFFLEEDNTETRQSKHTRLLPEKTPSKESVATTDSEASVYFRPEAILSPSLFPHVPPYLNFTSHADKGPPMPAALHRVLKWKLSPVMPKIVKRVVLNSGFRIIKSGSTSGGCPLCTLSNPVSPCRHHRLDGRVGEAHEEPRLQDHPIAPEVQPHTRLVPHWTQRHHVAQHL